MKHITTLLAVGALIGACATNGDSQPEASSTQGQASRGGELYQQHCASCHRADLSGDPDWKMPDDDGSYPPPPHDSSGHTWHHSDRVLFQIIRDGSDFPASRMPSFGEILSDADIIAILDYLKENWGPEEREYQQRINEQPTEPEG